jgi:hypothetical protein
MVSLKLGPQSRHYHGQLTISSLLEAVGTAVTPATARAMEMRENFMVAGVVSCCSNKAGGLEVSVRLLRCRRSDDYSRLSSGRDRIFILFLRLQVMSSVAPQSPLQVPPFTLEVLSNSHPEQGRRSLGQDILPAHLHKDTRPPPQKMVVSWTRECNGYCKSKAQITDEGCLNLL